MFAKHSTRTWTVFTKQSVGGKNKSFSFVRISFNLWWRSVRKKEESRMENTERTWESFWFQFHVLLHHQASEKYWVTVNKNLGLNLWLFIKNQVSRWGSDESSAFLASREFIESSLKSSSQGETRISQSNSESKFARIKINRLDSNRSRHERNDRQHDSRFKNAMREKVNNLTRFSCASCCDDELNLARVKLNRNHFYHFSTSNEGI